jgi:polysaccharide biosynthesis PFTS motif protein
LNQALLLALGGNHKKVVFPMPKEWREVLRQQGFDVAIFRSSVLWQFYVFARLMYGVAIIVKIIFAGILSLKTSRLKHKKYIYFADIGSGNLPQEIDGSHSYDIVSWYMQWTGKRVGIESIHHSVTNASSMMIGDVAVVPQCHALPALTGRSIIKYAIWGVSASLIATLDCLRGRWWHALLLNQAALAGQARYSSADSLACEYLFHNSGWIYRPLWTYEAERLGSVITLYFYSTNCEGFKTTNGYPPMFLGYKAMNWPHYLVWDDYQADFVRRAVGVEANITVVGSIWFQSGAAEVPRVSQPSVAVFDVTPVRTSFYVILGLDSEFYTPSVANPFLEHVCSATRQYNFNMLWKRKRNVGRIAHPFYRNFTGQFANNSHVMLVDPEISAIHVIESSVAVISMPFTSTAIIAREMGKPSIYYDPTGLLQKDDRAAHGIPILSTRDELDEWLSHQAQSHLV